MDQSLYTLYTFVFVGLTAWAWRLWLRSRDVGTFTLFLVSAAMIYENGILAAGVFIGHGTLLETLSWLRFIGYAVVPPLLVITGLSMAQRVGVTWASRREVQIGAWAITFTLAAFALFVEVYGRALEPRILNGVVRYMWVAKGIPPVAVILMNLVLIVLGAAIWRKTHNAALFLTAALLFMGDGAAAGKYVIGSGIEMIFMALLIMIEAWTLHYRPTEQVDLRKAARYMPTAAGD